MWLPLPCPQLGTWPATQACAMTENQSGDPFGLQAGSQSTESHQPGLLTYSLMSYFFNTSLCFWDSIIHIVVYSYTSLTFIVIYHSHIRIYHMCLSVSLWWIFGVFLECNFVRPPKFSHYFNEFFMFKTLIHLELTLLQ